MTNGDGGDGPHDHEGGANASAGESSRQEGHSHGGGGAQQGGHQQGGGGARQPQGGHQQGGRGGQQGGHPQGGGAQQPQGGHPQGGGQQPPQQGHPGGGAGTPQGGGGTADDDGGGLPFGKTCLGCGCAAILLLACSGALGAGGFMYTTSTLAEVAENGVKVRKEATEKRRKVVERGDIRADLKKPIEASDFDALQSTVGTWKQSEAFQTIKEIEEMDAASGGEPGMYQTMRGLYLTWSLASSVHQLGPDYVDAMEDHGGVGTHYRRVQRIGALIAATHEVAADRRFDVSAEPVSDEVARLLYEDHQKVEKAYGDRIDDLEGEEITFDRLASGGNLGVYSIALLPKESFAAWNELTVERRKKIVEAFGWTLAAETLTFGGMVFPFEVGKQLPML